MNEITIIILIYLLGYILAYIGMRKMPFAKRSWNSVISALILSILSWIGVLLTLMVIISEIDIKSKPPKWL